MTVGLRFWQGVKDIGDWTDTVWLLEIRLMDRIIINTESWLKIEVLNRSVDVTLQIRLMDRMIINKELWLKIEVFEMILCSSTVGNLLRYGSNITTEFRR